MLDDAESPEPLTIPFLPEVQEPRIFCTCFLHHIHIGVLTLNLKPLLANIIVWTLAAERFNHTARSFDFKGESPSIMFFPRRSGQYSRCQLDCFLINFPTER